MEFAPEIQLHDAEARLVNLTKRREPLAIAMRNVSTDVLEGRVAGCLGLVENLASYSQEFASLAEELLARSKQSTDSGAAAEAARGATGTGMIARIDQLEAMLLLESDYQEARQQVARLRNVTSESPADADGLELIRAAADEVERTLRAAMSAAASLETDFAAIVDDSPLVALHRLATASDQLDDAEWDSLVARCTANFGTGTTTAAQRGRLRWEQCDE